MDAELIVKNGYLVMPDAGIVKADLAVSAGRITGILDARSRVKAGEVIDAEGLYVFPGLVQPHAHLGKGEDMEDFATETRSAVVGGVTTVIVFYRGAEDYGAAFAGAVSGAAALSCIDFSYHLQIMSDGHIEAVPRYLREFGVSSFKLNMGYKGEEAQEKGILEMNDGLMYEAFKRIGQVKGTVACVHAENSEIIAYHKSRLKREGRDDLEAWSESRPAYAESEAIRRAVYLSGLAGCPLYVAHMTTAEGLRVIRAHRKEGGAPVYIEVCPQYLTHHMHNQLGRKGKFIPPLRTGEDNEALWRGLIGGDVDSIGIDQGTRKVEPESVGFWERKTSPREAATALSVLISEGFHKRGLKLETIARVTSANPARIFNLYPQKGALTVGSDADVAVVDLNMEKVVTRELVQSASDFSIYEGWKLKGWPILTICRGRVVMKDGHPRGERGWGEYLDRRP